MAESRRRRHLTADEKFWILEEAQQPSVQIAESCRRHGIGTGQFYAWREQARQAAKQALRRPARARVGPTGAGTSTCSTCGSLAGGTFLGTVIDAYSRAVVAWDLCWQLPDDAMALVRRQALDRTPGATPEIGTDNVAEFTGRDFLLACGAEHLQHIRTLVYHPPVQRLSGALPPHLPGRRLAGATPRNCQAGETCIVGTL